MTQASIDKAFLKIKLCIENLQNEKQIEAIHNLIGLYGKKYNKEYANALSVLLREKIATSNLNYIN